MPPPTSEETGICSSGMLSLPRIQTLVMNERMAHHIRVTWCSKEEMWPFGYFRIGHGDTKDAELCHSMMCEDRAAITSTLQFGEIRAALWQRRGSRDN